MIGSLIIGAGGHGKVIADILRCREMQIIGFLDDDPDIAGQAVLGIPILDTIGNWARYCPSSLIAGIGNNDIRRSVVSGVDQFDTSAPWIYVAHPSAVIADSVRIDVGTVVMAGSVINPDSAIGRHSIVNTGATIDHDCVIGDFVHIAPGAHLAGGVHVGDGTLLGTGCSVIPGCRIGDNAVIGAGAVVVCDIPAGVTAKGVPARW